MTKLVLPDSSWKGEAVKRIDRLLKRAWYGERSIPRTNHKPNCHGAVVYALSLEGLACQLSRPNQFGVNEFFPARGRPGYLDAYGMLDFLRSDYVKIVPKPVDLGIVTFWVYSTPHKGQVLLHSAVSVSARGSLFHQTDIGQEYASNSVQEIRASLVGKIKRNRQKRFRLPIVQKYYALNCD